MIDSLFVWSSAYIIIIIATMAGSWPARTDQRRKSGARLAAEALAGRPSDEALLALVLLPKASGSSRAVEGRLPAHSARTEEHKHRVAAAARSPGLVYCSAEVAFHLAVRAAGQSRAASTAAGRRDRLGEECSWHLAGEPVPAVARSDVVRRGSFEEVGGCSSCREDSLTLAGIAGTAALGEAGFEAPEGRFVGAGTTESDSEAAVARTADTGQTAGRIEHLVDSHFAVEEAAVRSSYPEGRTLEDDRRGYCALAGDNLIGNN